MKGLNSIDKMMQYIRFLHVLVIILVQVKWTSNERKEIPGEHFKFTTKRLHIDKAVILCILYRGVLLLKKLHFTEADVYKYNEYYWY